MATLTGSWNLQKAIFARWAATDPYVSAIATSSLDTLFKAEWAVADRTKYLSLNDAKARPGTPFPYCVASIGQDVTRGRASGRGNAWTETRFAVTQVQFTIHAANTTSEDSKTICQRMAALVAAAFAASTLMMWSIDVDKICKIEVVGDQAIREDEEDVNWSWVLLYEIMLEQTLNRVATTT